DRYFGLGLWASVPATIVVEGLMWLFAIAVYIFSSRSSRLGRFVFWLGIAVLTLVWLGNIAGPPPSNLRIIGFSSLTFFSVTLAWAYWLWRFGSKIPSLSSG